MKMANPYPAQAASKNTGISVSKNDNTARFTTPNPNSRNMGITNIVRAHKERKRAEKVALIADANIMADMCTGGKVTLKR